MAEGKYGARDLRRETQGWKKSTLCVDMSKNDKITEGVTELYS